MARLPQTTMVSPFDFAWNVVKGEAFHPSVAGYMAAGHGGKRTARPNAERDNRSRGPPSFVKPSMANMPLRPTLFEGNEKPVGPTGEPDPFESMKYARRFFNYPYYFDTEGMADRHDTEQEVQLPEPMLQRSFDSPIDSAWSILKELSREDLEMAARTGGIPIPDARRQAYMTRR